MPVPGATAARRRSPTESGPTPGGRTSSSRAARPPKALTTTLRRRGRTAVFRGGKFLGFVRAGPPDDGLMLGPGVSPRRADGGPQPRRRRSRHVLVTGERGTFWLTSIVRRLPGVSGSWKHRYLFCLCCIASHRYGHTRQGTQNLCLRWIVSTCTAVRRSDSEPTAAVPRHRVPACFEDAPPEPGRERRRAQAVRHACGGCSSCPNVAEVRHEALAAGTGEHACRELAGDRDVLEQAWRPPRRAVSRPAVQ